MQYFIIHTYYFSKAYQSELPDLHGTVKSMKSRLIFLSHREVLGGGGMVFVISATVK